MKKKNSICQVQLKYHTKTEPMRPGHVTGFKEDQMRVFSAMGCLMTSEKEESCRCWGLFLPPFLCAHLNSDWALTDSDYARSAPQLCLCQFLLLISLALPLQRLPTNATNVCLFVEPVSCESFNLLASHLECVLRIVRESTVQNLVRFEHLIC